MFLWAIQSYTWWTNYVENLTGPMNRNTQYALSLVFWFTCIVTYGKSHLCVPTNKSSTTPNLSERKSYDVQLLFISNFAIGFLLFNAITRIPQFKQIAKCKHLFTSIQAPFIAKRVFVVWLRKASDHSNESCLSSHLGSCTSIHSDNFSQERPKKHQKN